MLIYECIVLQILLLISCSSAYFGLTGKNQLKDWWSIKLQGAYLASAALFDENAEPEPSMEFQPVDLSPDLSPTFPIKRKRVPSPLVQPKLDDISRPQQRPENRPNNRPYANDNKNIQANISPYSRTTRGHKNAPVNSANQLRNRITRLSGNARRPGYKGFPPSSRVPNHRFYPRRNLTLRRQSGSGTKHQSYMRRAKLRGRRFNATFHDTTSVPHVRNERESGRKRDLFGIHRKHATYFVSSSYPHSLSPARVSIPASTRYHIPNIERSRFAPSNSTRVTKDGRTVLNLDEDELDSYYSFVNEKRRKSSPLVEPEEIDIAAARKMCDSFRLTTSQRRKCKRDPGMPQVLTEATHIAAAECQHQFRDERWNCSLGTSRIHILNKGNRETAFLFSISSAGLTHSVARACANGHLKRCSCDDSYDSHVTDGSWRWDGCGDNVHYAAKFVRRFLKSRSTSRDIRAEVDKHNSDLGIRVVKSNVKVTCKCHGVSGSCTTKTCWRKMAPFYEIGRKIKRAYDKAVKVGSINNSNGRARLIRLRRSRLRHRKLSGGSSITSSLTRHTLPPVSPTPDSRLNLVANTYRTTTPRATLNPREELKGEIPRNKELVYLEKSPTYCRKSRYSKGTKGRVCKDERSCDKVCCGRGYTTHVRLVRRSCQCEVKWCCAVHCNTCSERKKIHTCK